MLGSSNNTIMKIFKFVLYYDVLNVGPKFEMNWLYIN